MTTGSKYFDRMSQHCRVIPSVDFGVAMVLLGEYAALTMFDSPLILS